MPFLCAPPDSPFDTLCPHSISALKGLDFWGVYREGLYAKSPPYPLLSLKIPPPPAVVSARVQTGCFV